MATAKKATAKAAPKKQPGTGLQKWDEQLAKYAAEAAATEANAGSGLKSFSLKAGVLSLDDAAMPNNEMAVIILDHILENVYYEEAYDPDNPAPPTCFALARTDEDMAPHKTVFEHDQAQHPTCAGCPMNEWGSAEKGRGKACRNTRRLLMIPAGSFNKQGEFTMIDDEDHFSSTAPAFMKLPVTSTTGWAAYVKQLAGALRKPPFAVVTKVKVVPDPKTQFRVTFEAIDDVTDELIEAIIKRHEEAVQLIDQPYNLDQEEEEAKPQRGKAKSTARGSAAAKGKAKPTARKKY